jgi:hypothetical protein
VPLPHDTCYRESKNPDTIHLERTVNGVDLEYLGRIAETTGQRPHGLRADGSSVELAYRGTNDKLYYVATGLPLP